MQSLEAELDAARDLDETTLADAIETIGFECTRCGACCKGYEDEETRESHTATVFPDEVRDLQARADDGHQSAGDGPSFHSGTSREWRDIARPMPYGLSDGGGETFEWALQTDGCGDCRFYEEDTDGRGACSVHADRPLICRTYPFSVALDGTSQPLGEGVDQVGRVRAHECEGLGRDIDRKDAEELAAALKTRATRELEEAIAVRDSYEPADPDSGEIVVHDSEGAKHPDGTPVQPE